MIDSRTKNIQEELKKTCLKKRKKTAIKKATIERRLKNKTASTEPKNCHQKKENTEKLQKRQIEEKENQGKH